MSPITWSPRWFGPLAAVLMAIVVAWAYSTHAQQADSPRQRSDAKPAADGAQDDEADREVRRLPAFYREVLAPYQRQRVYDVQAKYEEQIKTLQAQIKALLAQRDAEIEQLLNAEQREVLKRLKAEAAQRAKELAARKKAAEAPPAEATESSAKKPATENE